jgi:hypothetical protein
MEVRDDLAGLHQLRQAAFDGAMRTVSAFESLSRPFVMKRAIVRAEGIRVRVPASTFSARLRRVAHSDTTRRLPRNPRTLIARQSAAALRFPASHCASSQGSRSSSELCRVRTRCGRPAASFARGLMLPVSNDALLRVVRRRGTPGFVPPTVVGIDDWAWRRNQRYGTIICDLERRRTIALLPDREPATAQVWLLEQTQIKVVARDRGGGYELAAAKALPTSGAMTGCCWRINATSEKAFVARILLTNASRTTVDRRCGMSAGGRPARDQASASTARARQTI